MIVVRQCQHFSSYHYRHHHRRSSSCDGRGTIAISSIFPLTYVRLSSIASPPTLARSTHLRHHLLITLARPPTYETFHGEPPTMRREAHHLSLHTRLSRGRLPSECRSHGKKLGVPELSRGAPLVDSAERRTSSTVCEKARARFPRYPPRISASCPLRSVWTSGNKEEKRVMLCVCVCV